MRKKKGIFKKLLIINTLILVIFTFSLLLDERPSFADSGFSTSYDSGGSSYSSSSSSSSSGSEDISPLEFAIILSIGAVILIFGKIDSYIFRKKEEMEKDDTNIELEVTEYIPYFNKEEFLKQGYNIFCDVQEAWMNFKLEDVKDKITDELYKMYESQLITLKVKDEQNIMKDFELKEAYLSGVSYMNNTITITAVYIMDFYDYIIKQSTGELTRGIDKWKMHVKYEIKFRKSLDENNKVTKCPNCGADIEMNTSGICEYCHTKLVTENTKWVLTEKKLLDQKYNIPRINDDNKM